MAPHSFRHYTPSLASGTTLAMSGTTGLEGARENGDRAGDNELEQLDETTAIDHADFFAVQRSQLRSREPTRLLTKSPKKVSGKFDRLELIYRRWFLVYLDGQSCWEEVIREAFNGELPSDEKATECYRRLDYHTDNWWRAALKKTKAQVLTAVEENPFIKGMKDEVQLALFFEQKYSHSAFESAFSFPSDKLNIAASAPQIQEYTKYLFRNWFARVKLHLDWEAAGANKDDDYSVPWMGEYFKTFGYSSRFEELRPSMIQFRPSKVKKQKKRKAFNIPLPDHDPRTVFANNEQGIPPAT